MKEIEIFEDILDIEEKLNTNISSGLSRREAKERSHANERDNISFFVREKRPFLSCFFGVVKMLPAAILALIAIAAFFMGRVQLAVAVLSTFISGSIISGMLYLSAQRESERMEKYSNPTVKVLRGGKEYITDSRNLVVGDVISLCSGDYIPADACVVESVDLVISEITFDGEVKYVDRAVTDSFDGKGRLLAGSFVNSGHARAVVTATGGDVCMARHIRAGGLGRKNSDPKVIKQAYKYLSGFVFVLSVIALILAIVGMFTAKYVGMLEIFLMYLSLILSMMLISSPIAGRILLSSMLKRASKSGQGGDYAIIKNNRAIDALPIITDLVVCGLCGISTGEKRFSSMLLYGDVFEDISTADKNSFIFECIYSYIKARKCNGNIVDSEKAIFDGLLCGMQRVEFDSHANDIKTRSVYFGSNIEDVEVASVEAADMSFRVYLGDKASLIDSCDYFRDENGVRKIDDNTRLLTKIYVDSADSRGESVYVVISEIDGKLIFEGAVGLGEIVCDSFMTIKDELAKKEMSVTLVTADYNEYNRFYFNSVGFSNDSIMYACEHSMAVKKASCAYMGYSAAEYATLIKEMKASGRNVAVLGIGDEYSEVYEEADVVVSYDNINYGSPSFRESELEVRFADGYDFSQRCTQRLRARADVIIGRGNSEYGGLRGFFEAFKCAETFSFNYMQMILLFLSCEAVLVFMTLMSFISGLPMISYPTILFLVVAVVFFSVAAFSTFKQRAFISKRKRSKAYFTRQVIRKIVPAFVASVVYSSVALYLDFNGYIMDAAAIPLATTIGVIITYVLSFGGSMRACIGKKIDMTDIKGFTKKDKSRNRLLNMAAMTLVLTSVSRMILMALLMPGLSVEYGYTGVCVETFILLGVYFATFAVIALIIRLTRLAIKHHK